MLDAHDASFVSVTQSFNTTTSMGRLTLNMLLSFAQFEREIAGERIRDKIAASKAKGMWMGGTIPLGYDVEKRKLIVNEAEARTVRLVFERYAELGSVTLLQAELARRGLCSKRREGAGGRLAGGGAFSRGVLYLILQNHLYRGEVAHKGTVYPGQHAAIIDADLWRIVQDKLAAHRRARTLAVGAEAPSLLSGLVFDADGHRMTPTHAVKRGRRYRYYISASLLGRGVAGPHTMRVPAGEIEGLVLDRLHALIASRREIADALDPLGLTAQQLDDALGRAADLDRRWLTMAPEDMRALARETVDRVTLSTQGIEMTIAATKLAQALGVAVDCENRDVPMITLSIAAALRRAGRGKRLVVDGPIRDQIDASLVRLLQEAFAARDQLLADTHESINAITARSGKSKGHLSALMRLSYLAPDIIDDMLSGRQPPDLSAKRLLRLSKDLPLSWCDQRAFLGYR